MSLRLRLTLLNGLVLLLVLAAFALVAYVSQARALDASLDTSLRQQAQWFSDNAALWFDPRLRSARAVRLPRPERFTTADALIQIVSPAGQVESRSGSLGGASLPVDAGLVQQAMAGQAWYANVDLDHQSVREYVAPVRMAPNGGIIAVVQVARPTQPIQDSLRSLQTTLLGVGLAGVLVSLFAGWLLARASLRPIESLAAAAHAIGSARDFARRVPLPHAGRRDELGRLTTEFNGMLTQLQQAHTQLQDALAAQRRFVADASHELRTPLSVVRGNLDLAALGAAQGEDVAGLLDDARAETARMGRLVSDLLLLAQADAGQHLILRPVALGPILHEAFRAARFFREGLDLRLGPLPDAACVAGDADRLKQVVLILLDNAVKFTPPGGRVTLDAVEQTDQVTIRVTDTGRGIAAADRPRVFERFARLDPARGFSGAGLGLAIARWITEEHAGAISIAEPPGGGTQVSVRLPTLRAASASPPAASGAEAPQALKKAWSSV